MAIVAIDDPQRANIKTAVPGGSLIHHIMPLVTENRQVRDRLHKRNWDQYERTFRGLYSGSDKTRQGERSRLVSPVLAAAVDSVAATIEDAIFSRDRWFDTEDDVLDRNPDDMKMAHRVLDEDLDLANVPDAISKIVLNGCLYGTGIGKINIIKREIRSTGPKGEVEKEERALVTLTPIPPWEFVIDSQARDIDSAYFCAHETFVPKKKIWNRMQTGTYRKVSLLGSTSSGTIRPAGQETPDGKTKQNMWAGSTFVTEYYGLVHDVLLNGLVEVGAVDIQGNAHVEVIVTIANELELLRVIVNPFKKKDRPVIAYQHNYVPGKFWGRGVSEKGWNSQRALDAELRARMDALGLVTAPMLGADITRLGNNSDLRVRPGKVILTRGRPSEVLEPINLGTIDATTFNQSSEMERLVQVATGSMDSNAPLNVDRRNETASGISMIQSSALKRMRRTMWNIERQFLNPLIRKAYDRYMQFASTRYPQDNNFRVRGTMGIVAREFEQANLTSLLSVVQPESPTYNIILQSVIELSNSPKRDEILQRLEEINRPDPEEKKRQELMKQIQIELAKEELKRAQVENAKTQTEIQKLQAEIQEIQGEIAAKQQELQIQAKNAETGRAKAALGFQQDSTNRLKIASEERREKIRARATRNKGS
ncbi:MAG: hypothetical protein V3T23_08205 [Nitrososphaerales archaeon]